MEDAELPCGAPTRRVSRADTGRQSNHARPVVGPSTRTAGGHALDLRSKTDTALRALNSTFTMSSLDAAPCRSATLAGITSAGSSRHASSVSASESASQAGSDSDAGEGDSVSLRATAAVAQAALDRAAVTRAARDTEAATAANVDPTSILGRVEDRAGRNRSNAETALDNSGRWTVAAQGDGQSASVSVVQADYESAEVWEAGEEVARFLSEAATPAPVPVSHKPVRDSRKAAPSSTSPPPLQLHDGGLGGGLGIVGARAGAGGGGGGQLAHGGRLRQHGGPRRPAIRSEAPLQVAPGAEGLGSAAASSAAAAAAVRRQRAGLPPPGVRRRGVDGRRLGGGGELPDGGSLLTISSSPYAAAAGGRGPRAGGHHGK